MAVDQRSLRDAFGAFATGVTVVTTIDEAGGPRGFTANSFTSVSLDPPLLLVCLSKNAGSYPAFVAAGRFAVNVLAEDQEAVSAAFASSRGTKFAGVSWRLSDTGSPLIEGVVAWFDCVTHDLVDAGDHVVLIGRVAGFEHAPLTPLGYCRGAYVRFGLASKAVEAADAPGRTRIGMLIEHEGRLYLPADGTGVPTPPNAPRLRLREATARACWACCARRGSKVSIGFVFAVFHDPANGDHHIYYRGQAISVAPEAEPDFVPLDEIALRHPPTSPSARCSRATCASAGKTGSASMSATRKRGPSPASHPPDHPQPGGTHEVLVVRPHGAHLRRGGRTPGCSTR